MKKCLDCKKEIYKYSTRCKSCAKKDEFNPFYSGGKEKWKCIECNKLISFGAKRCKSCTQIGIMNSFYGKRVSELTKNKMRLTIKNNPNHQTKHQWGVNNPIYKNPGHIRINKDGTKDIKISDNYWISEYRHLVNIFIGRKLKSTEIVHHIDGDRTNNYLHNLYIFTKKGLHANFEMLVKHGIINRLILQSNLNDFKKD